jgi:hypothetical protein
MLQAGHEVIDPRQELLLTDGSGVLARRSRLAAAAEVPDVTVAVLADEPAIALRTPQQAAKHEWVGCLGILLAIRAVA